MMFTKNRCRLLATWLTSAGLAACTAPVTEDTHGDWQAAVVGGDDFASPVHSKKPSAGTTQRPERGPGKRSSPCPAMHIGAEAPCSTKSGS